MEQAKLKNVHNMLKIHFGEYSEMEMLTLNKNIISKEPVREEMIEEDHCDVPEEKLDKLFILIF